MLNRIVLMAAASMATLMLASLSASADSFVDEAKAVVAKASGRVDKWDGPTAGPKAVGKKTLVYVAGDMRNGGILGVAQGVKEAAGVIGWDYREIDGQGTVSGQATALSQAVALKPDAIIVGGSDCLGNGGFGCFHLPVCFVHGRANLGAERQARDNVHPRREAQFIENLEILRLGHGHHELGTLAMDR